MNEEEILLTSKELAKRWGVKVQTIYNNRLQTKGVNYNRHPSSIIKYGRRLYKLSDIINFEKTRVRRKNNLLNLEKL